MRTLNSIFMTPWKIYDLFPVKWLYFILLSRSAQVVFTFSVKNALRLPSKTSYGWGIYLELKTDGWRLILLSHLRRESSVPVFQEKCFHAILIYLTPSTHIACYMSSFLPENFKFMDRNVPYHSVTHWMHISPWLCPWMCPAARSLLLFWVDCSASVDAIGRRNITASIGKRTLILQTSSL